MEAQGRQVKRERTTEMSGQREKEKRSGRLESLGGLIVGMLAVGLFLGSVDIAIMVLLMAGLLGFLALLPPLRRRFLHFFHSGQAASILGTAIGALAVSGFLGDGSTPEGEDLMALVVIITGFVCFAVAMFGNQAPAVTQPVPEPYQPELMPQPATQPVFTALPAQAEGDPMPNMLDLCRGLAPELSGQVMATAERLDNALHEAKASRDSRRMFDAEQALQDYLPTTVKAWKAQNPSDRRDTELLAALAQLTEIVGSGDTGTAQRQAWETQQRFLRSKAEADLLKLK